MRANGIRDRAELAKLKIGVGQTTIYRSFDENWAGKVQVRVLAAIARWTKIALPDLVASVVTDDASFAPAAYREDEGQRRPGRPCD